MKQYLKLTIIHLDKMLDNRIFSLRRRIFGMNSALQYLKNVNKQSIIQILRSHGASIGNNCDIESSILFHNCADFANLSIGDNCHIGKNCFFDLKDKITIENNVTVSMGTYFITHMDCGQSELSLSYPASKQEIRVGSNTYVGANVTILMGVEIGEKCLISAGSVVNKTLTSCTMATGVPAIARSMESK